MVGWFALFCESCGAKQPVEPKSAGAPPVAADASPASPPANAGKKSNASAPAPRAQPAPTPTLEAEVRTHLVAPQTDARSVARDMFQTQLGLMHRHREGVEDLIAEVESIKKDLARLPTRRDDARKALDGLSERMFESEQRWGELQVSYNRDSEAIEEESRESMETADLDAYLSPDEHAKVEAEYTDLSNRFETVDALLRDTGRAIKLSRQGADSRYLGAGPRGGTPRLLLLLVTALLVGWSMYSTLFLYKDDPQRVAATVGPVLLALALWVMFGFSRRGGG
jgi:hypothetical protein